MNVFSFTSTDDSLLLKAFLIRRKVFIEEQHVTEEDEFDAFEKSSIHYLAFSEQDEVGTARWRITEAGIKLERFAVLKEYRSKGYGIALMKQMLKELPKNSILYLHAQTGVIPFYEQFGFSKKGVEFSECDMPHYLMERPAISTDHEMSVQKSINHVKDFHHAFSLHVSDKPSIDVEEDLIQLRFNLMKEENEEYLQAAKAGDIIEIADALGDMLYILNGTIITHGMQHKIEEVFEEIQRSNMSKLDRNGNPVYREDGKVLKSDQYFKPNIEKILKG